jgi:GDP-4-dehydro-6-deoxy-D-mannose reductase
MTTALVFAGSSFIGGHLCRRLRQAGLEVTATARSGDVVGGLQRCDLTAPGEVEEVVARARPRWVFQCAGATRAHDPNELYRLHVDGTLAVLGAVARHVPAAPVVLMGSAAEYGPVPPEALPVKEDYPAMPPSFFGASKLAQTHAARAAAAEWELGVLVVRPFNVIGPGLPAHYFAAALAARLQTSKRNGLSGEFPVVNPDATRDFVDVRDVVEAMLGLVARAAPPAGSLEVYNIASGEEMPVRAVAAKLCRLAGDFRAVGAGAGKSRSGIQRSCGDPSKLKKAIGWAPRVGWEQSIEDLWRGFTDRPAERACADPGGTVEVNR